MGFFNRVAGLMRKQQAPVLAANGDVLQLDRASQLRAFTEKAITTFRPRARLTATHRTSHRTVAMDLRDAKKRRHIAKRNKTAQHNGKRK